MKIPFRVVSPFAVALAELLAFAALYLAPEVERNRLLWPLGIGVGLLALRVRLPDRILLVAVALFLAFGALVAARAPTELIATAIATALVPAHALLWLARDARTYRFWRAALAFLEVVLAAIIAPETYMFVIIFFFVVASAVALSFGFLERNFAARDPEALSRPVRPSFLLAVVCLSFVIFLSSLVIFPVLPRSPNADDTGNAQVGYTEVVSFRTGTLGWAAGNPRTVMWVTRPSGVDWRQVLPGGLVRGKVLERFSGVDWTAAVKARVPVGKATEDALVVDFFREPLPTEILPVPYGTVAVEGGARPDLRYASGEWPSYGGQGKAVAYVALVARDPAPVKDEVRAIHRALPSRGDYSRLKALATTLNRGARSDEQRVERVLAYLRPFNWELGTVAAAESGGAHPIDTFLFDTKRGHCELFATAAALLLREMGVPTRLAVGFRVGSLPRGDLLSVKNTDAHAWVEAFVGESGWRAIDPTPLLAAEESIWAPFEEAYGYVNVFWQRYIMSYEFDGARWRGVAKHPAFFSLLAACFAAWLARRAYRHWRQKLAAGTRGLAGEIYLRLESLAPEGWQRRLGAGSALVEEYRALRFGREMPARAALKDFERRAKRAIRSAAKALASSGHPGGDGLPPAR